MKTKVKKVLKSWRTALERKNELSSESINYGVQILADYLKEKDDTKAIRSMVREVMEDLVNKNIACGEHLLRKIQRIFALINKVNSSKVAPICLLTHQKRSGRPKLEGQEVRFKDETAKIFEMKLKFKKGMPLRTFDIDLESARDSKKVRRIVEKRMCQAYQRMNKRTVDTLPTNSHRYWMQRATSFQLYNIGQVEDTKNFTRGLSTHWKKMYDPQTGRTVFKKKMAYSTYEAACAEKWKIDHPGDLREMQAYKCSVCQKWHIGHKSELVVALEREQKLA